MRDLVVILLLVVLVRVIFAHARAGIAREEGVVAIVLVVARVVRASILG